MPADYHFPVHDSGGMNPLRRRALRNLTEEQKHTVEMGRAYIDFFGMYWRITA